MKSHISDVLRVDNYNPRLSRQFRSFAEEEGTLRWNWRTYILLLFYIKHTASVKTQVTVYGVYFDLWEHAQPSGWVEV